MIPRILDGTSEVRPAEETEQQLVERADSAQDNEEASKWIIGECASKWIQRYAKGRTDADFGARLKKPMSQETVNQRRKVWERFGGIYKSIYNLTWTHFLTALTWEDAEIYLQWANDNKATVAGMKVERTRRMEDARRREEEKKREEHKERKEWEDEEEEEEEEENDSQEDVEDEELEDIEDEEDEQEDVDEEEEEEQEEDDEEGDMSRSKQNIRIAEGDFVDNLLARVKALGKVRKGRMMEVIKGGANYWNAFQNICANLHYVILTIENDGTRGLGKKNDLNPMCELIIDEDAWAKAREMNAAAKAKMKRKMGLKSKESGKKQSPLGSEVMFEDKDTKVQATLMRLKKLGQVPKSEFLASIGSETDQAWFMSLVEESSTMPSLRIVEEDGKMWLEVDEHADLCTVVRERIIYAHGVLLRSNSFKFDFAAIKLAIEKLYAAVVKGASVK